MAVVNIGQVVPTNIIQQVGNAIVDEQFSMDQSDVTVTTTNGTIVTFTTVIKTIDHHFISFEYVDIKISGLSSNTRPTVALKCNRLKNMHDFWQTLASGARGGQNYSTCYPTDGAALTHQDGSDTMNLNMMSYFVPLQSGYYHVTG